MNLDWNDFFDTHAPGLMHPIDAGMVMKYARRGYDETHDLIARGKEIPAFLDPNLLESMSRNRLARIEAWECGALQAMREAGLRR